jgi:thioredoxin 1
MYENTLWEGGSKVSSITITTDNFQSEVLQSPLPVLIDFWAPWCGPCKMIGPVIDQIGEEYSGRLKVGKVNVDNDGAIAEQHGVTSIPALFVYKNGALAGQRIGAALKHEIEALFKDLI